MSTRSCQRRARPKGSARCAHLALTLACLSLLGCQPEGPSSATPLRPLLYTEAPESEAGALPGFEAWSDPDFDPVAWPSPFRSQASSVYGSYALLEPTSPDRVMLDVYFALVTGDADRLSRHLFTAEELVESARMSERVAEEAAAEIEAATRALLAAFVDGVPSELREDGVAGLLEPGQLEVGRGRRIDGTAIANEDPAVMHWGNELGVLVRGAELSFSLRFPSLLQASDGTWRLRRAPQIDERFATWRGAGFDLKPEMMEPGHAPFPLDVGNYWHYRTREIGVEAGARGTVRGHRDEVVSIDEGLGYRVARLRRTFDRPGTPSESWALLQTPRRLYPCDRECVRKRGEASWILDYAHRSTPWLVLPLEPGARWGRGGRPTQEGGQRVAIEVEPVSVPSGTFDDAVAITRSTSRGRQVRMMVGGVGFVLHRTESATETFVDELTEFRILQ